MLLRWKFAIMKTRRGLTDLARKMAREGLKYGIQFNLMHAISREERPEAEFWRRIDVDMIGEAFDIPDKDTDKDPNVKWSVPAPTILAS